MRMADIRGCFMLPMMLLGFPRQALVAEGVLIRHESSVANARDAEVKARSFGGSTGRVLAAVPRVGKGSERRMEPGSPEG